MKDKEELLRDAMMSQTKKMNWGKTPLEWTKRRNNGVTVRARMCVCCPCVYICVYVCVSCHKTLLAHAHTCSHYYLVIFIFFLLSQLLALTLLDLFEAMSPCVPKCYFSLSRNLSKSNLPPWGEPLISSCLLKLNILLHFCFLFLDFLYHSLIVFLKKRVF